MGTAVLRSHDCLKERLHLEAYRPEIRPALKPNRKNPVRSSPPSPATATMKPARVPSNRSNRSIPPAQPKPRSNRKVSFVHEEEDRMVVKAPARSLVMEEVTILKRGEDLKHAVDRRSYGQDESVLCSTGRIGPEPEILPKQIRFADSKPVYAGPGFFASPAPSSLPFPALLVKKGPTDEATRGLRGLLRLDDLP